MKIFPKKGDLLKTIWFTALVATAPIGIAIIWFETTNISPAANSITQVTKVGDTIISNETETATELDFSDEQLRDYYIVYENPFVIATRKLLDEYLRGGTKNIETVIKPSADDDGNIYGLDSFSKDYYRSKFVVFARNPYEIGGGEIISVVFVDKPDKLFNAWIYQTNDKNMEMRGFWQDTEFGYEEMRILFIQYGKFMRDKEHTL